MNIVELEQELKIKTLEVISKIRTNSEADTVLCLLSSYICLLWPSVVRSPPGILTTGIQDKEDVLVEEFRSLNGSVQTLLG